MEVGHNKTRHYVITILGILVALIAHKYLSWLVHGDLPTFITFSPVIIAAALMLGTGPGLVATALTALLADYFIMRPTGSFGIASMRDALSLLLFLGVASSISIAGGSRKRHVRQLLDYQNRLEELVERRTADLTGKNRELQEEIARHQSTAKDLVRLNENLEQRVLERTADLADHLALLSREISERADAEEALARSEERYRSVVEDQTELIIRCKPDGTLTFVNETSCRFFAVNEADILGTRWQPYVVDEDLPLIEEKLHQMSAGNPVVVLENRVLSGCGKIHWMQFATRGLFDAQGELLEIQAVGRDITTLKEAQENLKSYAYRVISLEEELRKNIAMELHDDVGQELTALSLNLAHLCQRLQVPEGDPLRVVLADSRTLVKQVNRTVRNLMMSLRPTQLDDYGLASALRSHADQFQERTGIAVSVQVAPGFPRLLPAQEITLFRITQEALNNVLKHAQASRVTIALERNGSLVRCRISDDGTGDLTQGPAPDAEGTGWGLAIMRERAELMGGSFCLVATPGKGTTIVVELAVEM